MTAKAFAVIPTKGERNQWLEPLLLQLQSEDVYTIVVTNAENALPPVGRFGEVLWRPNNGDGVNLSRMWNHGLERAEALAHGEEFYVAVLNDDLALPAMFVDTLASRLAAYDAAAAFPTMHVPREYVLRHAGPTPLHVRMTGWAFVLNGRKGLRADDRFTWWYGDDDLDWTARLAGGTVGVPYADAGIVHYDANGYTSRELVLAEQAGDDRKRFEEKWGLTPW